MSLATADFTTKPMMLNLSCLLCLIERSLLMLLYNRISNLRFCAGEEPIRRISESHPRVFGSFRPTFPYHMTDLRFKGKTEGQHKDYTAQRPHLDTANAQQASDRAIVAAGLLLPEEGCSFDTFIRICPPGI
jgi:hypothetical protein